MKKTNLLFLLSLNKKFINWVNKEEKILILKDLIKRVSSFEEYKRYAVLLDKLEGNEVWKRENITSLYDYKEVEALIKTLQIKKETKDINGVVHYLRSNLLKNLYSTNNPALYHQTHHGTKYLIESFQNEILSSLKYIYKFDEEYFPLFKKLEFFSETRHAYGRTALLLSGGASFGMYHIGVIKALHEQNLIPKYLIILKSVICGSSAGSIIASLVCTSRKDEVLKVLVF